MNKKQTIILLLLSLTGFFNAIYLTILKHFSLPGCTGAGCDAVLSSDYSTWFNIPISVFGIIAFLTLSIRLYCSYKSTDTRSVLPTTFIIALIGTIVHLHLTLVQAFKLQQWCIFCTLSALLMTTIMILSVIFNDSKNTLLIYTSYNDVSLFKILPSVTITIFCVYFASIFYSVLPSQSSSPANPSVIATFDNQKIKLTELDEQLGVKITRLKRNVYNERLRKLQELLLAHDAKKQGISVTQLKKLIIKKETLVSSQEVQQFYTDHKENMGGKSFDEMKNRIKQYLTNEKETITIEKYIQGLKTKYQFYESMPRPFQFKIRNNPDQIVAIGPKNAKLKITAFSDFTCPHCKKTHHKLDTLYQKYPNDIQLIFRQYPLSNESRPKALAALCADQQNQYLAYSNKLYAMFKPLNQTQLTEYARQLNLNIPAFQLCLNASRTKQILNQEITEAKRLSVLSTPTLFFNGEYINYFPNDYELNQILKTAKIIN